MLVKKKTSVSRFKVLNTFVDVTARDLTRSELLVWLALYRDARDDVAATSQGALAKRCGVARKTVERAIKSLTERGLLKLVYRGGLNRGTSKYKVLPMSKENYFAMNN